MFDTTRTYKVTYHHPRGSILGRDVCLSDAAFRDRKALGAQLRKAGVLSTGARVTAFRGEAGGRISLERRTPHSSLESLPVILECIPFDMPRRPQMTPFLAGYVECALWSSNDESDESDGEPLDKNYSGEDITDETLRRMAADCERFQRENAATLESIRDELAAMPKDGSTWEEMAGHLFWLDRNGHGTGYWDRDLGDAGDTLSEASKRFGEVWLCVGDDGTIDGH